MFCGFCGTELPDQMKFCNSCGKPTDAHPSTFSHAPTTHGGARAPQAQQWSGPPPGQQAPWGGPAQGPNGAWAPTSQGSGAWGGQSQGAFGGQPQGAWGGASQGQQGGWSGGASQGQHSAFGTGGWAAGAAQSGWNAQQGGWVGTSAAQWGTIPSGTGQGYAPQIHASAPAPPGGRQKGMESDLMAMGAWSRIYGAVVLILGVLTIIPLVMFTPHGRDFEFFFITAAVLLIVGFVCIRLGIGLERFEETARIGALVLNVLVVGFWLLSGYSASQRMSPEQLMGVVLGSGLIGAVYVYALVVLSRAGAICTPAYKEALKSAPDKASMYSSVFYWVNLLYFLFVLAMVALAFVVGPHMGLGPR